MYKGVNAYLFWTENKKCDGESDLTEFWFWLRANRLPLPLSLSLSLSSSLSLSLSLSLFILMVPLIVLYFTWWLSMQVDFCK